MQGKISKVQLNNMIDRAIEEGYNQRLNENPALKAAGQVAGQVVMDMMKSKGGRNTLANILLYLPNLIRDFCDAKFSDYDDQGKMLGNLKTKLCKFAGYAVMPIILVPCKILGEMLMMLDDKSAKAIIDGAKNIPTTAATEPESVTPNTTPGLDNLDDAYFELDNVPTGNIDIAYNPEDELALMENHQNEIRALIRESLLNYKN